MNDVLLSPIRLTELEALICSSIEKVLAKQQPRERGGNDSFLTVQEAADFLNLTTPTIYSKVSRGELPFMKRSKRLYFSKEELLNYVKAGRQQTNAEIESEANLYLKK